MPEPDNKSTREQIFPTSVADPHPRHEPDLAPQAVISQGGVVVEEFSAEDAQNIQDLLDELREVSAQIEMTTYRIHRDFQDMLTISRALRKKEAEQAA